MATTCTPQSIQPKSRRLLWIVSIGLLAVILLAMAWLSKRSPQWFNHQFTSDAQMESRSADFEQGLAAQFTKVRGQDSAWAIRIPEKDMNEWLASRLPKWLEHQGKSAQECNYKAQVRCRDDRMDIAAENSWSVGVLEFQPQIQSAQSDKTTLNVAPTSAAIGCLPIPTFILSTFVPTDMFESLQASEFRLADGRRVMVKDIEVLPGEIRMQLETSPNKN